jgi:hypothetical protein
LSVLLWFERGERLSDFDDREKKNVIYIDLEHQNDQYLCQMISFDKGVHIMCLFTFKDREKIDISSGKFFISS